MISYCHKKGVKCYPVCAFDLRKPQSTWTWHLEVDNNGSPKRYRDVIGNGSTLRAKQYDEKLKKLYEHWYNLLKQKE